jgi:transposase
MILVLNSAFLSGGNQALTRDAGEMADDFGSLVRRRRLDHSQVETVIAILREVAAAIGELDQKGTRLPLAP